MGEAAPTASPNSRMLSKIAYRAWQSEAVAEAVVFRETLKLNLCITRGWTPSDSQEALYFHHGTWLGKQVSRRSD